MKSQCKVLSFFVIFTNILKLIDCQISSTLSTVSLVKPSDCTDTQYYDISHLKCLSCPTGSQKKDLYNCMCTSSYYVVSNYGGGQITCSACATGQIQSVDGYSCVTCNSACQSCSLSTSYRADTDQYGNQLSAGSTCITCQATSSILLNNQCSSCRPFIFMQSTSDSTNCNQQFTSSAGFLITGTVTSYDYTVQFGSDSFTSAYFTSNLQGFYLTCSNANRRNVTSCQALANLCVLKLYSSGSANTNTDACTLFNNLVTPTTQQTLAFWPDNLPWLSYPQTLTVYKSSYDLTGIGNGQFLGLQYGSRCTSNYLSFYAAQYGLTGNLLNFGPIDISKFQLCNYISSSFTLPSQINPFSATNFYQSCSIQVQTLLELGASPTFYDMYLKYDSTSTLLPLPAQISVSGGTQTTQNLDRRFFLVDAVSALQSTTANAQPKYIRYAKTVKILVELSSGNSEASGQVNGQIYPPVFFVTYDYVSTSNLQSTVTVNFEVVYSMSLTSEQVVVSIISGVLVLLSFFWAIFRTWIWNKRAGKLAPDLVTLFKFFMFWFSALANVLFLVMVAVSLYWLIVYKGQTLAFVVVPSDYQEVPFVILLIVSFFLKLLDVLHLIFTQSSYDIFFIDWERPKAHDMINQPENETSAVADTEPMLKSGVLARGHKDKNVHQEIRDYNKISCWRTLFVSNEWNELQTFRKINPTIQLIGVLFFLKVINLEALTTADCNTSINPDTNSYQAPYSSILRIAMAASMYLGMGLFQYLLYILFYIRCFEDKTTSFMDLCSVANISMFIMSHAQFGYYIHGRSPHGNADTSMQEMARAFMKEQSDITAKRGLGQNSEQQAFSISISDKLSKQYRKVMDPLLERRPPRTLDGIISSEYEKRILAYSQLNKFLAGFIDNVLRDLKYIVVKRNFIENILDLEFKEPIVNGYFYADEDKSFESVLFCGQERKLFVFDLLTFLFVDFFAKNYVLSAFVVYIVVKIYNMLRDDLGTRNLSRKTLVDKRFLI